MMPHPREMESVAVSSSLINCASLSLTQAWPRNFFIHFPRSLWVSASGRGGAVCKALRLHGAPCDIVEVDAGHGMNTWEPNKETHHYKAALIDWLKRTLK